MKKIMALGLVLIMLLTTACSKAAEKESAPEAASQESAAEESAAEDTAQDAAAGENTVLVKVNTEGLGEIAVSETGETPVFEEEYPTTSAFMNVEKGSTVAVSARAGEDYQFVKWTNNGEMLSEEAELTLTAEEDMDLVAVFAMSSGFEGETVSDVNDAKTMGDVLGLPSYGTASLNGYFVYAFELNGTLYRAVAPITQELSDQIFELDFDDPEYEEKYNALVAPLAIDHIDDLNAMMPPQEELDAYIGKTVGEMMDEGWEYGWGYNLDEKTISMSYGLFSYNVGYEGELDNGNGEIELEEEDFRPLTVTSVAYEGLGNMTADLEAEMEG